MALTHYERERAAYLRDRAADLTYPDSTLRRVERLERVVRRDERSSVGVQGELSRSGATPDWLTRWARGGGDGDAPWRWGVGVGAAGLALIAVGPALLIGAVAYSVWHLRVLAWGPLRSWPYLLLGANVLGIGAVLCLLLQPGVLIVWLWIQLSLGLLRAGWLVRQWGWAGVETPTTSTDEPLVLTVPEVDEPVQPAPERREPEPLVVTVSADELPDQEIPDDIIQIDLDDEPVFGPDADREARS